MNRLRFSVPPVIPFSPSSSFPLSTAARGSTAGKPSAKYRRDSGRRDWRYAGRAVVDLQSTAVEPEVDERRLYWVGPMTVVAATLAVWVVQHICLFILPPLPEFSGRILSSIEPALLLPYS